MQKFRAEDYDNNHKSSDPFRLVSVSGFRWQTFFYLSRDCRIVEEVRNLVGIRLDASDEERICLKLKLIDCKAPFEVSPRRAYLIQSLHEGDE